MGRYIALLRAVNVGRTGRVPMVDLRKLLTNMGYWRVQTLLQSGNVVFDREERTEAEIASEITGVIMDRMGVQTDVFLRKAEQWEALIANNPFPNEAIDDPSHLVVVFTTNPPVEHRVRALQAAIIGRETVKAAADHLYAVYPDGIGESKLTIKIIERELGSRGTARNWNTVVKLMEMAAQ
jgi:uncharacterized protein (DUF1697 family)